MDRRQERHPEGEVLPVRVGKRDHPRLGLLAEGQRPARHLAGVVVVERVRHGRVRRAVCRLPELPLGPGRYCLTLNAGPRQWVWSDVIDQALWFEVTASDFYGNGKLPNPDWGRFLVRSQWSDDEA